MLLFFLYNIFSYSYYFLLPIIIRIRIKKNKEDPLRIKERYGVPSVERPAGKLVWIHSVSVGELNSVLVIVSEFLAKNINVLVTTTTLTSAKIAKIKLPNGAIHQMLPLDYPFYVKRFLKYWKPDITLIAESELWPNIFYYSSKYSKLYLINTHIVEDSFNRWCKYAKSLLKFLLNRCDKIYTSSIEMKTKIEDKISFNPDKIIFLPHTKYDILPSNKYPEWFIEYKKQLVNKTIIIFASTHPTEDDLSIKTHIELKKTIPNLLTIIAPRHLNRIDYIKNGTKNLNVSVYPQNNPTNDTEIIIINTIGDLLLFYSLADIAVVCGSFIPKIGGHNPLEPANLSKAIIIGEHVESCEQICHEMLSYNAIIISNIDNILENLEFLSKNKDIRDKMGQNAFNFIKQNQGSSKKLVQAFF